MLATLRMSQKRAPTAAPPSQAKGPVWGRLQLDFLSFYCDMVSMLIEVDCVAPGFIR